MTTKRVRSKVFLCVTLCDATDAEEQKAEDGLL
jgi:hypothetical protein